MTETTKIAYRKLLSDGSSRLKPGFHITFDDGLVEECTWHGPYPSEKAADEAALALLQGLITLEVEKSLFG